jgi:hypothetical protein
MTARRKGPRVWAWGWLPASHSPVKTVADSAPGHKTHTRCRVRHCCAPASLGLVAVIDLAGPKIKGRISSRARWRSIINVP